MKKALISPQQNNLVVEVLNAEFPIALPLYWVSCPDGVQVGWTYGGDVFIEPVIQTPSPSSQFTSLEFLAMFTPAEQLAVVSATLASAPLKLWYDMMLAASYVDLVDPRTIGGLNALVGAALITEQRKDEILG